MNILYFKNIFHFLSILNMLVMFFLVIWNLIYAIINKRNMLVSKPNMFIKN